MKTRVIRYSSWGFFTGDILIWQSWNSGVQYLNQRLESFHCLSFSCSPLTFPFLLATPPPAPFSGAILIIFCSFYFSYYDLEATVVFWYGLVKTILWFCDILFDLFPQLFNIPNGNFHLSGEKKYTLQKIKSVEDIWGLCLDWTLTKRALPGG